jgi:hypothetical protein
MPLSLTCDCGARFELDDALAGQSVSCPECQAALKAPAAKQAVVRTSGFALASTVLALVGAFTVVGTAAAVVLGAIGAVAVLRDREHKSGLGFSVFGMVFGTLFTGLTLWSISSGELFGIGPALRRQQMADQLETADPKAPLDVQENGFTLAKPSAKWAKAKKDFQYPNVQPLLRDEAVLLVQPDSFAFVDVQIDSDARQRIEDAVRARLRDVPLDAVPSKRFGPRPYSPPPDDGEAPNHLSNDDVASPKKLTPAKGEQDAVEFECSVSSDGRPWKLLVQAHRTNGGKCYIVRGFCEKSRFERLKDELRKAVESFTLAP